MPLQFVKPLKPPSNFKFCIFFCQQPKVVKNVVGSTKLASCDVVESSNHVKDKGKSILTEGGSSHIDLTSNAQPKRTPK